MQRWQGVRTLWDCTSAWMGRVLVLHCTMLLCALLVLGVAPRGGRWPVCTPGWWGMVPWGTVVPSLGTPATTRAM